MELKDILRGSVFRAPDGNPFNGIERCFIVEFVDFARVENPFNGIESLDVSLKDLSFGLLSVNPFNGIESVHRCWY